ncbi:DUF3114 domain-containing protein [Enterococcus crotali]|uniref:DUF3114 domain-containing protein n=1 Tax=Enterococcus crotali TaxID=1453587 RepID=UPI00046F1514|nr:DUF3114 domain-containing protein [Enterococcus crotali]
MEEIQVCLAILEKIEKPKKMTELQFKLYKETILEQIQKLQQQGWDEAALVVYINQLNEYKDNSIERVSEETKNVFQAVFFIGSDIYTKMFIKSRLLDQEKAVLVIDHLGGELDEKGDLYFAPSEYLFCPQMPPGAPFLASYSETVQRAYPNGLIIAKTDKKRTKTAIKKKYATETKIHQFRNRLDKNNIEYIENYKQIHGLKNDEAAIKLILRNNWFYADPQYHNRACLGVDILMDDLYRATRTLSNQGLVKKIRKRGFYRKILSGDYHSEFILDEQGQLLSQWKTSNEFSDYLESAIVNGESFNYGKRPREDREGTHHKLDGNPPRYFDTDKRNELKKIWLSPTDQWFYQLVRRLSEKGLRYRKRRKPKK